VSRSEVVAGLQTVQWGLFNGIREAKLIMLALAKDMARHAKCGGLSRVFIRGWIKGYSVPDTLAVLGLVHLYSTSEMLFSWKNAFETCYHCGIVSRIECVQVYSELGAFASRLESCYSYMCSPGILYA